MNLRSTRPLLLAWLVVLPLSNCVCPDDTLGTIAPAIYADVCNEPPREIDGTWIGGFEECGVAFGERDISVRSTLQIKLTNPTTVRLCGPSEDGEPNGDRCPPMEIFLTEDSDPSLSLEEPIPTFIEDGLDTIVTVGFRPNVESEVTGTLVIRSDAKNLPEGQDVIIPITGTGVDNGIPNVEVSPQVCDFGRVASGGVAQCVVTVENTGSRALVFDGSELLTEFDGETFPKRPAGSVIERPFDYFGAAPREGDSVAAPPENNRLNIALRFTPDALGPFSQKLRVLTNDPDTPEIIVDLEGIGVEPPECIIEVKSVNGVPFDQAGAIEPLDDVILTAENSAPSTASGTIASVQWIIEDKPLGSTAVLTNPNNIDTGFTFADVLGVDLAGRYTVRALVSDDLGTESVNDCTLNFEAVPTDSILVQLSWDTSYGEMDLHFIKQDESGDFCAGGSVNAGPLADTSCGGFGAESDCYYANCKATGFSGAECTQWDDDPMMCSPGDPSLDIDDLSGYGPENTNIDVAVPGEYMVGVDYFSGGGGSGLIGNTIRIYLYGLIRAEFFAELDSQDWWEVAVIEWPGFDAIECSEDTPCDYGKCNENGICEGCVRPLPDGECQ